MFGMDADFWMALQAIHSSVHNGHFGAKYTWFGSGYISNMYFKMISNKPMYHFDMGGDLSFTSCFKHNKGGGIVPIFQVAYGDVCLLYTSPSPRD